MNINGEKVDLGINADTVSYNCQIDGLRVLPALPALRMYLPFLGEC